MPSISPGWGPSACKAAGLTELEDEGVRGLGGCELASHKTESVFSITQGRGGEGEAAPRQKTVEEQEEQEGEK